MGDELSVTGDSILTASNDRPVAEAQTALPQAITSIIIIMCNKLVYNKLCIESIRQYTKAGSYELIVVDNNSTDGTCEWLQSQHDLKLIKNNANLGFPAACNQGIKVAVGNGILLLNNDAIVTPNWLVNLNKCLFSSIDIGAVGAVTNACSNFQSIPCEYASRKEMLTFAKEMNLSNPERWENRTRLVGYCMLIKAEVVNKIGFLEEAFSPGNFEDDDYCLRIRKAGYRLVLCRDTFIHHFGSVSFGEQATLFNNLLEVNKQKFIAKWGVAPHIAAPYELTRDLSVRKWFIYQHELSFYEHWLENTRRKFFSIVEQAEFAVLAGKIESALVLAKQAADYAYHAYPGFFISHRLEQILREAAKKISKQAGTPIANIPMKNKGKRNVLHVLSQGYSSGQHTRMCERWISMDVSSVHSLLVTLNSTTTPAWLKDAVVHSGGWYNALDFPNLSLCQKAKVVRDAAAIWADLVVLHIHPHDPIAPVAFGVAGGPPVVFSNHADHAFSIGTTAADIVADYRTCGQQITIERRNRKSSFLLPLPLKGLRNLSDKQAAKKELAVGEDRIVFFTVAAPYQMVACGEYNFVYLLKELVNRHQNIEILVVGPSDIGEWTQLKDESAGRIRAFGYRQDLNLFYSAADVYLDSVPLGSLEEALEAGGLGIPVVGLAADIATHFSGDIVPDSIKTHGNSISEFFQMADKMIHESSFRLSQGKRLQTAIQATHYLCWPEQLATLYSLLPSQHQPAEVPDNSEQKYDYRDVILACFQHKAGLSHTCFG
ncbi:MAG: rhamnosyltran: rhamnosyltransferase [Firmicutes bacterium]|nr:rhamnosyltran: rhamnosyltransferase [Bacillota bacterium]